MNATATLSYVIRDAAGVVHKPGEAVQIIRHVDQLGKDMLMVEYLDHSRGIVNPGEIEQ